MRIRLNWGQRIILIVAGVLLLLFGLNTYEGYAEDRFWLATVQFLLAIGCFVLAASSKGRADA